MTAMQAYYSAVSRMNPEIAGHLPSIEWLVSHSQGSRRTGRSFVLATAFLKAACTTNGAEVRVFDHQRHDGHENEMVSTLRSIAPSVHIAPNGKMEPQPAYAFSPDHHSHEKLLNVLMSEFSSLCSACMRHGVSVSWMLDVVKQNIVESVMKT